MEDKVQFTCTIRKMGNSLMFAIPTPLIEYLALKPGTKIKVIGDQSKHGKHVALWNPGQKK